MHSRELVFGSASKYVSSERLSLLDELLVEAAPPPPAIPPPAAPPPAAPAFLAPPVVVLRVPVARWFRVCISWKRLFRIVMRLVAVPFLSG